MEEGEQRCLTIQVMATTSSSNGKVRGLARIFFVALAKKPFVLEPKIFKEVVTCVCK